jgi:heme exporter protein D
MHWTSLSEFFSMGGYGFYVWGSYGITLLLLGGEVLLLLRRKRSLARRENPAKIETRNSQLESSL